MSFKWALPCVHLLSALRMKQTFGNRIFPDTHLILLPEIIVTHSRTEVYAEWLLRHGILRRNNVFIDIFRNVPFTWRFIDNYDYMFLVCVAKKYDDMLSDWMKSRFISPRPARLGLLHPFIVGGQCHTRPFMHVAGVLSCCAPVGKTSLYSNGATGPRGGGGGVGNPSVEIRRSYHRLISTIGFPILVKLHLFIESGPRTFSATQRFCCICTEIIQDGHINTAAILSAVFPHTARLGIALVWFCIL